MHHHSFFDFAANGHGLMHLLGWLASIFSVMVGVVTPHKISGSKAAVKLTPPGGSIAVIGALVGWTLNFKNKPEDSTSNDDNGWATAKPGIASWTATADFMYIEDGGDPLEGLLTPGSGNSSSGYASGGAEVLPVFTFYPEVTVAASGENSWVGSGIVTDWKLDAKNGKTIAYNISIEGSGPLTKTAQ